MQSELATWEHEEKAEHREANRFLCDSRLTRECWSSGMRGEPPSSSDASRATGSQSNAAHITADTGTKALRAEIAMEVRLKDSAQGSMRGEIRGADTHPSPPVHHALDRSEHTRGQHSSRETTDRSRSNIDSHATIISLMVVAWVALLCSHSCSTPLLLPSSRTQHKK